MALIDVLLELEEDDMYAEARKEFEKAQSDKGDQLFKPLSERDYIKGQGNWLTDSKANMSEEEIDDLFDKIKF